LRGEDFGIVANLSSRTSTGTVNPIPVEYTGILGSKYNDILTGDSGVNNIQGGIGDDIIEGGDGADKLDGGTGADSASFQNSPSFVIINLSNKLVSGGDADGDSLLNFEGIIGSAFNDTLTGDANAN
jgi:Ca2+-binding RTX toxin-like protein